MMIGREFRREIVGTLARYRDCYQRKDVEGIMTLIAPEISGYGSGPDEKVTGCEEFRRSIERDFTQCDTVTLDLPGLAVYGEGIHAWVTSPCTFTVRIRGTPLTMEGRWTSVLRKEEGRWLISQIHFSIPHAGQAAGQSYANPH